MSDVCATSASTPGVQLIGPVGDPYAVVFRVGWPDGSCFHTRPEWSLQIATLVKPVGADVRPHTHPPDTAPAARVSLSEFLHVVAGRVRVTVFDENGSLLDSPELAPGEMILLLRGGHGLQVLENARIVEVRQGPFAGAALSKIYLDATD